MILPIRHYPDPVLRAPVAPVGEITPEVRQLAADMAETMKAADGVGLAAPQVGVGLRLVVVNFALVKDKTDARVLVNPKLDHPSKSTRADREGCLSFPGIYGDVRRSVALDLRATDLDGQPVVLHAEDYLARVLQHEIDHLDNVLFIDRMGPAARFAAREGLAVLEARAKAE